MELQTANRTIATLLILINLYFLPITYEILVLDGGPMGVGFMILSVSISINLLLIMAGLALKKQRSHRSELLVANAIGLVWALCWCGLLVTATVE